MSERFGAVSAVLLKVLLLNLGVAAAKLVLGFTSGAVSVVSDGVHSLTDGLSNVAALVVVVFIGHAAWQILRSTSDVLSDHIVIPEDEVRGVVLSVPAVMGCHEIRTRGSRDFVFLDLHIWMAAETPLLDAHEISHVVKDRLMQHFPAIGDAVIHIEPPPRDGDPRA